MSNFEKLKQQNPNLKILSVNDDAFADYGIVYSDFDLTELNNYMDKIPVPEKNVYVPKNPEIESMEIIDQLKWNVFGGMNLSAGQCAGYCDAFSAIEFHQGSEVNITFTDVVMVLGKRKDIHNQEYNAEKDAKLFFVPKGTVFEMYSDTIHYSPIHVSDEGFKVLVVVLDGTNEPFDNMDKISNKMVVKRNKFQLAHKSRLDKIEAGILPGVTGELIKVKPVS